MGQCCGPPTAGAARRLVQSAVIVGVLTASSAAAVLGLTLSTSANEGFNQEFTASHGADLAVTINAAKVTAAELARTRHLTGVIQAAGPYQEATIIVASGKTSFTSRGSGSGAAGKPAGGGLSAQQLTVVGRASPSGPLDHIDANPGIMKALTHDRSRWPSRQGEISLAMTEGIRLPLGSTITVTSAPGIPKLTIVGYGAQQELYDGGWVEPADIAALRAKGAPVREEMFYTFSHAATTAQISADLAELKRALPGGAIASSQSWLFFAHLTGGEQSVNTPFVVAFAILALVLAVLIVANVVSGAVVAGYRRIGVLKSIGFTPGQVTVTYLAQIGLPALAGIVAGTFLGGQWALPVIGFAPAAGQHVSVPLWINLTALLSMGALTGLAALVPALRAGRLPAVQAIAAGQAPRSSHGYGPHRLLGLLGMSRPVTIGLAAPFGRPARSAVTLAALTFGLTGVIMAAGLYASIHKINHSALQGLGQVQVGTPGGRQYTLTPRQNAKILTAVRNQPGTLRYVAETDQTPTIVTPPGKCAPGGGGTGCPGAPRSALAVHVAGRQNLVLEVHAYDGGSAWLGWPMASGHWPSGPRQADVDTAFLTATGRKVGDKITLIVNGRPVVVRIVGQVFAPGDPPSVLTSWPALGGAAAGLAVSHYDVALRPGTSTGDYIRALTRALGPGYDAYTPAGGSLAAQVNTSYFRLLALAVAILAGLGVLNSVLMAVRERVHDLGVFKAVGMTPRQTIIMIISWIIPPAIIAAAIALPVALSLEAALVQHLSASAFESRSGSGPTLPGSYVHVLGAADLSLLTLAGLVIAAVGALGPALWAATSRTITTLRAE